MLYTRHECIKVKVKRHGIMIIMTAVDNSRRWRITKQFGVEEIPMFKNEKGEN